ncbi:MAG: glycosyl transferase [Cyanobacteria bacterium RYN_339]|nr:glycosyl transferase [Cyanobacteria bacterium RYN_339]
MIVRNEARSLARCLASAKPWVDELVVVDTGSTDETVAIAEAAGAKVVHFPWCDDFSAARNASLEAASGTWALILDADETLVVTDEVEWRRAQAQDVIDGFSFEIFNLQDDGQISKAMVFRLFRRTKPGMRYRGEIHEQVAAVSDSQATTAALGCAHFTHDGYTSAVHNEKDKSARNIALSRKLVANRPADPYAWYALGLALKGLDVTEMVAVHEKALALWDATGKSGTHESFLVSLYVDLALGLRALGRIQRAVEVLDRGLVIFPASPDLHHHRGTLRLVAGDLAGAGEDFQACLAPEARAFMLVLDPHSVGAGARTSLAYTWLQQGRNVEAEQALEVAVNEAPPGFTRAHQLLGAQHMQRGNWHAALPLLEAAFGNEPEEVRFNLAWCRFKLERYDEAAEILQPLAGTPEGQHLLGRVRLEQGQGEEALALLEACPLPPAGLARGWAFYLTGKPEKAAACWEEWLRAGAADWGTKDTLATFMFLIQGGRPPKGEPERPAEPLRDMNLWFRLLVRYHRFDDVEAVLGRGPQLGDRLWRPLRKLLAATLANEGQLDVALHLLLEAQQSEPEDADIYYWLGYAALHRQHPDDAATLWQTCLAYDPEHLLARQGLSLIGVAL